ncbi:MAG: J domain-containing protein [Verrucomicrobia bacterium]|nr:J domain-containing protein [Verrucomicrobiota bacterium]
MKKDLYLVLRVTPQATADEIRSAYRRLALQLHPDHAAVGSDPFLELQDAYAVLSNPERRAVYDRELHGISVRRTASPAAPAEPLVPRRRPAEPFARTEPMIGSEEASLFRSFETFSPSIGEIFERLWSNFTLQTRPKADQPENLTVEVPLSPEQAYVGGEVRILVPARVTCPACRGRGDAGPYECAHCQGRGTLPGEYPVMVRYPAGLQRDYAVQFPLDRFGIENFYLTVRLRPTGIPW